MSSINLSVTVWRSTLINKLQENRKAHEEEFTDLDQKYRSQLVEFCESATQKAKDCTLNESFFNRRPSKPQSHLESYDLAIDMLNRATGDTVDIGSEDYDQLVLDNWSWKGGFSSTKAYYDGGTRNWGE